MKRILIATADAAAVTAIEKCFADSSGVVKVTNGDACRHAVAEAPFEYVFVDLSLIFDENAPLPRDVRAAVRPFRPAQPGGHLVVLTTQSRIREAVRVVKTAAADYLTFPITPAEIRLVVTNLADAERKHLELEYLRDHFWKSDTLGVLRSFSPKMHEVLTKVKAVAPTRTTVLLTGESGTGKGVVAHLVHRHSDRAANQFIAVHCGAIPDTLIESELFGHERGSFTGAHRRKMGKFEIAQFGTIFLDEIGTVTPAVQVKLLQVLQERVFHRVGGEAPIESDVRIVTATNSNLKTMVEDGTFRRDLFYRLNVFPIELPPLRERLEDVPLLAESFLAELNRHHGRDVADLHPDTVTALCSYHWPGNIRELENVIERAYILETSSRLSPENLPPELRCNVDVSYTIDPSDTGLTLAQFRRRGVEVLERRYLEATLERHRGSIKLTAGAAGICVRRLHRLLTRYGIRKEDFKTRTP